jgi:hypothetical protein
MRRSVVLGTAAIALLGGISLIQRRSATIPAREVFPRGTAAARLRGQETTREPAEVARGILLYAVPPIWIAAGAADWLCHRRSRIEHTSGTPESLMHLLMLAELGVPTLCCMFLEITPPVLALSFAAFFVHQGTALWDLEFAAHQREISPVEQQVHSFLELMPLMTIALLTTLHWPEFRALAPGHARHSALLAVRPREKPLPAGYVLGLLGAITLLNGLPYLEEVLRCWRAARSRDRGYG